MLRTTLIATAALLAGCAGLPGTDPLKVTLAGLDPLPGEGMELRIAVKLRVQNPNDTALDYRGVALTLDLRGQEFASGVSDVQGTLPRFSETVLVVPVTVSAYAMAKQALGFAMGERSKVDWVARGKLASGGFGGTRFETRGEFDLPASVSQLPGTPAPRR